ncbi:hypothetical protein [Pseudomonas urmiensis]|uniref:hypothetical protein n=1 Tax=Pseudomonas urmiensis TaxID=2745493 RepID=UPI003C949FBB
MNFVYSATDGVDAFYGVRSREQVRERLNMPFRVFAKIEFSENSTDVFGDVVIKAWYDKKDRVSGVQLYHPEASLSFKGQQILGRTVNDVERFLQSVKVSYEFEADGSGLKIMADALELGLYAPDLDVLGKDAHVEAIYVPIPSVLSQK